MAKQTINIGTAPNDGTGTPLRTSFDYTNQNFTELYNALGGGVGLPGASNQVIFNDGGTNLAGDSGLTFNKTTDTLSTARITTSGDAIVCSSTGDFYVGSTVTPQFKVERATGSATITGDLTVRTNRLIVNSNGTGIGTTPSAWGAGTRGFELANGSVVSFAGYIGTVGAANSYYNGSNWIYTTTAAAARYDQDNGSHIWFNAPSGTAGNTVGWSTAMTLNSTGLGVGGTPVSGVLLTVGSTSSVSATANALQILSNKATFVVTSDGATNGAGTTINYSWANGGQGPLTFRNNLIANVMTLDASGRLLVGSTAAFTDLTGSKEVKIGDGGMQTLTVASLPAATATNIARGGVGGLVYVGGYNGNGQYGAVVLWTAASATVVSVINGTGSTITFGVSGGFLQITSSLVLTQVTGSCIRL